MVKRKSRFERITQSDEFDRWAENNEGVLTVLAAVVGDELLRKELTRRGLTPFKLFMPVIIARVGVEIAGVVWSAYIDDEEGVVNWMHASSVMFDWWGLEDIPIIGTVFDFIPNPVGVGEIISEGMKMQFDHVRKGGVQPLSVIALASHIGPIAIRRITDATIFNPKTVLPRQGHPTSWI